MPTYKRLSATFIMMFGVVMALVGFAVPAGAAPYATQPATSVSNQAPAAGSGLQFCGSGFAPGETVTIAMGNGTAFPSVTASSSGEFCATMVLGVSLSGTHTLVATGTTSGRTSSTTIQIAAADAVTTADPGTTSGGELAFTGAAVIGIGALGALLLLGGALMVFAGRRREGNL